MTEVQSAGGTGSNAPNAQADEAQLHRVEYGDTLTRIARDHAVTLESLLAANPQIANPDRIYPGDVIEIPPAPLMGAEAQTYTVVAGDTLSAIGQRFNVDWQTLADVNGIANPDLIVPGQVLSLDGAAPSPAPPPVETPGDGGPSSGGFDYNRIAGVEGNANVTPQFIDKVESMAARLDTRPEYIMAVMSFETGGTFSPSIKNPVSSATGLIQFLSSTAQGLGTSTAELSRMSAVEQLDYVEAYFRPFAGQLDTLEGTYTAVLSGSPKPDPGTTLFSAGSLAYSQNAGLDSNSDGRITSAEATSVVRARIDGAGA